MRGRAERGDTLIEVLLGIVILSMIVVGAITLMGFGIAQAENSVEHSEVRTQIDGQANILLYLRDQYVAADKVATPTSAVWAAILASHVTPVASSASEPTQVDTCTHTGSSFYLDQSNPNLPAISTSIGSPVTFAKSGQGLWIDAYAPYVTPPAPQYVDFIIKGCWQPAGNGPEQQEASVIRIYNGNI